MSFLKLYLIFFKIGLFTIGGGLAAVPLLQDGVIQYKWMTMDQFFNIMAISQSTPGPIGVNMATYVGYTQLGFFGALVASLGLVSPSFIIILIIAKFFTHFNEKQIIKNIFYGLRPGVTGLIGSVALTIFTRSVLSLEKIQNKEFEPLIIFIVLGLLYSKVKWHPLWFILLGALGGILFL